MYFMFCKYSKMCYKRLAKYASMSLIILYRRIQMVKKPQNHRQPYLEKDIKSIKSMAKKGITTEKIAKELGRTEGAIRTKASEEDISLLPKD